MSDSSELHPPLSVSQTLALIGMLAFASCVNETAPSRSTLVAETDGALVGHDGQQYYDFPPNSIVVMRGNLDPTLQASADPARRGYTATTTPASPKQKLASPELTSILDTSETVQVVVVLNADGVPVADLRRRHSDEFSLDQALLEARSTMETSVLDPMVSRIESAGGRVVQTLWLNPSIVAIVDGNTLRRMSRWPEVATIHADDRAAGQLGFSGVALRQSMRTDTFIANGINGGEGGRGGASQIYGVMDLNNGNNFPNVTHAGFQIPSFFLSRVANIDCRTGGCINTSTTTSGIGHGNQVMKVLGGSIELGSDPNITDPTERTRRSGNAQLGAIYYYSIGNTCSSWRAALQRAILQHVDVINISDWISCSGSVGSGPCYTDCDCGGLNADIRSATAAGMLVVSSAGNFGDPGTSSCNETYPAIHPDVVSVGALSTPSESTNFDSSGVASYSSRGGIDLRLYNGTLISRAMAGLDITAPGDHQYQYTAPRYSYDTTATFSGTSFASPAVAGALGLLRQQFANIGWPNNDARLLQVHVLLMGDSYDFDVGGDDFAGMSTRTGSGRSHFHYPNIPTLVAPWGWGWHKFTISSGQHVDISVWDSGPESPNVTQWKVAMLWDEADPTNAADIVLEAVDLCPPGGGEQVVRADFSFDLRKRIELSQTEIGNKCLYYRISAFGMPAGETRTVFAADFFHGGDPSDY